MRKNPRIKRIRRSSSVVNREKQYRRAKQPDCDGSEVPDIRSIPDEPDHWGMCGICETIKPFFKNPEGMWVPIKHKVVLKHH
jgi:hypothetical protein